jgi:RHS repeat-associated protein
LGSITAITDSSRNVVQRYSYDSFGKPTPQTSFRNSYQFTGREWDKETGLHYYRARYYDPVDGRFISIDPIGFAGGDVNLLGYTGGNPLNRIDPTGLDFIYIVDANALGGLGHAAAIVGPVNGKWTYNSYGPVAGDRAGQVEFTSEKAAMTFAKAHGYTDYAKWVTDENSSSAAQNVANQFISGFYNTYSPKKRYNPTNNNCQTMVNSMAVVADLPVYVGTSVPNQTFPRASQGADYVGKYK